MGGESAGLESQLDADAGTGALGCRRRRRCTDSVQYLEIVCAGECIRIEAQAWAELIDAADHPDATVAIAFDRAGNLSGHVSQTQIEPTGLISEAGKPALA